MTQPTFSPFISAIQQRSCLRVVIVDEVGDDLRAQAFERFGPAVFLRVELGVAGDDPAEIAVTRAGAECMRLSVGSARRRVEQRLDRLHRRHQLRLLVGPAACRACAATCSCERFSNGANTLAPRAVSAMWLCRASSRGGLARDQAVLLEIAQHAR